MDFSKDPEFSDVRAHHLMHQKKRLQRQSWIKEETSRDTGRGGGEYTVGRRFTGWCQSTDFTAWMPSSFITASFLFCVASWNIVAQRSMPD